MPDPNKAQLTEKNPLPKRCFPVDECTPTGGVDMAREGYAIIDRANPRDSWRPRRQGVAPPVYNDGPTPDWGETR